MFDIKQFETIAKRVKNQRILVIGDVGVDCYMMGKVERISPEAPVPVLHVEQEILKLGLAANVADNIQAMSASSVLVGVVGNDKAAEDLSKLCLASGIMTQHLVHDDRKTIFKTRMVAQGQQLIRIDQETTSPISERTEEQILQKIFYLSQDVDAIILEDYAKGMITESLAKRIFKIARRNEIPITVDPNLKTPAKFYRGASLLTPNTSEAERLSGIKITCESSLRKCGEKILKLTSADAVVITRGGDGMAILEDSGKFRMIPTFAKEVYDVSGAGDTVISALTLFMAAGASLYDAVILANVAAGIEVGKQGTATVSLSEIRAAITA